MTRPLSPRERRIVAVGLLIAVVVLAYAVLIAPVIELYRGYGEEIAELTHRLEQQRRVAADVPTLRRALADLQNRRETSTFYLDSASPTLAVAELQSYVESAITRHGGQLVSTQIVPDDTDARFPSSAVTVNLRGSVQALRDVLYALESGRPLIFVEGLSVSATTARVSRLRNRTGIEVPEILNVRFDAVAYRREQVAGVDS